MIHKDKEKFVTIEEEEETNLDIEKLPLQVKTFGD